MNPRVLFVDDEINVLSGLRRMLRAQRNEWDMLFANSGDEALKLLEQSPCDVIVSDMRMPGIDGAELLRRVAEQYPNTVRLVLSGQSEHERIFRAVGPAHQFLSKPCDEKELVATIKRACSLQSHLQDVSLRNVVSQVGSLPSLPELYKRLVVELEADDTSVEKVGEIIESDLGMSVKVLQLVNSSFFGLPQHVACPKHAVSLLGLNVIRPLCLTAGAFSQYEDSLIDGFSLSLAIDHSLQVATAARRIADLERSSPQTIDDAFIAGMLHDIGKLILASKLTAQFQQAVSLSKAESLPLWQAEFRILGTTHAEIGAHLLDLWGLPTPIVEAVAFHHRPEHSKHDGFAPLTAVYVANTLMSQDSSGSPVGNDGINTGYLDSIRLPDRMDAWRQLVGGVSFA